MSKVKSLHHIVFCTKRREYTIPEDAQEDLYRYIWAEIRVKKSKLIRIGGIGNHVHLLLDLNPAVALAEIVAVIKAKSSGWMKTEHRFRHFHGWAKEYYAVSVNPENMNAVTEYIKSQKEHHNGRTLENELEMLHAYAGLNFHPADMTE